MNNKAQLDFDMETIAGAGLGLLGGMLALYVMKGAGLGFFWKIMTFVCTSIAGFVISKIILSR